MNKETAVAQTGLNSMNQYTPDGSLEYSENGKWSDGTPKFSVTQSLSPGNQALYDLNNKTQQTLGQVGVDQSAKIAKLLSDPLNLNVGGMPYTPNANYARHSLPGAVQTESQLTPTLVGRQDIASNADLEKRLIDLGNERLNPQLANRRSDLDAALADKGIKVGSDAYSRSMLENNQAENDARNQLILTGQGQAFDQAATRANTAFTQDMNRYGQFFTQGATKEGINQANRNQYFTEASANAANEQQQDQAAFDRAQTVYGDQMQGRQQTIDEILQGRNQPINEITALMSGSQIAKPTWTSTPQSSIAAPDLMGLVASNYKAKSQNYQGMLSGLGSIFGTVAKAGIGML